MQKKTSYGYAIQISGCIQFKRWNRHLSESIRLYHVKEENKKILDNKMNRLCYLGILKEGFLASSSPVMLISRKVSKEKRVSLLNIRIAKNNL